MCTWAQSTTSSVQSPLTGPATTIATIVMPELTIPAAVYPVHINSPGRGKDYLCQICHFPIQIWTLFLTHVRQHLNIMIGCIICGKGYQNAASLWPYGRDAYNIQIVASAIPLKGLTDPKEEI